MSSLPEDAYKNLSGLVRTVGLKHPSVTTALVTCVRESMRLLADSDIDSLISRVPGKSYFAFSRSSPKVRTSRGINAALWLDDADAVAATLEVLSQAQVPVDPHQLHAALYTAAICLPAALDVTKDGDKKSPGTYLEYLVGQLVARRFDVRPTTTVVAPTLDLEVRLPTDFIFDLGAGKSRIHLPVKASTRERVIQVWAHQRVLDGMHGVNRFRGVLVVLAETNRQTASKSIVEVCLPQQWIAYQMYIAQLHRVYYFDVPDKYRSLREHYPFLEVRPFSDFFYEADELATPTVSDAAFQSPAALDEIVDELQGDEWIISSVDPAAPALGTGRFPEDKEV